MKRILITMLLTTIIILPGLASAGEYESVYVWYAGKGPKAVGAPPNAIKAERYYFTFKKDEYIETVSIKGYGPYVKRLHIVLKDKNGYTGSHLVRFANAKKDAKGFYTYTYKVEDPKRWSIVTLEYKTPNFNPKNRVYTEPSLFWIEKVNDVSLEPPTDEDDLAP